ncbi:MAG TPA: carboxypeptidase regulatory-like domain-containing protein [Gemmatimonadales bacterium]|nr:carboxypeptidase regulatory-like domain-containing protein [Gemmatimonadales bacterium]
MTALPAVALALLASSFQASADSTARIRGKAGSAFNGQPLAGVTITVAAVKRSVVTDSTGVFSLDGLPSGRQVLQISYQGRTTDDYPFALRSNSTQRIVVLLDTADEKLSPTVVEARQAAVWRDLAGFYERRELYTGFARFFTREEIGNLRAQRIGALLTLEGIATRCGQWCVPTRLNNNVLCAVPVNVNGMPYQEVDYDEIPITDVAAVEIYRGVPPVGLSEPIPGPPGPSLWVGGGAGERSGLTPVVGHCGLVMIWTR